MAEYLNRAAALAQSAAELSRKVSENIIDRSRELGLDPTSLQTYEADVKPQDIKNYLDSSHERDKISALRKIIKLISKGVDTSEHFAGVVKNVASKSLEVRKLVYIYILRYAEQEPDLALLSINTFQKDLTDPSPVIRALALRVLSGIRVRIITPIVVLALRKSAADLSPYVRKSAAFALVKCQTLDPGQTESILELLRVYLEDNSHISLGGVVMAFNQICPQRYDLIHPHYRKLCRLLPEFDEWSQISTLQLLLRYARTQFIDPCQNKEESPTKREPSGYHASIDGFYEDIEAPRVGGLDPDHALLLKSVTPLLLSQNSGVVLSTATLIFHTSPDASSIAKPLVRLLRSHRETQYIVLTNISVMVDSKPGIFSPYLSSFYVRAGDPKMVRDLKLDIASTVVTSSTLDALLKELFSYSQSPDEDLARTSIRAMAKCIACSPKATTRCLSALLDLLNDKNHVVVGEAVTAIKQLLQSFSSEGTTSSVLARLIHLFHKDYETLPSVAKAAILWLVGQYSSLLVQYAPDIFRVAVRDFAEAEEAFKMQTLTLGIKLMAQFPDNSVSPFFSHLMALARYDRNFHVRDRARLIQGSYTLSQGDGFLRNHLKGLFCDSKPAPSLNSLAQDRKRFSLGSASLQLNHQVRGYQPLPEWPLEQPDGSARNKGESLSQYADSIANETRAIHSGHPPGPSPHTVSKPAQFEDLDAFYGDDSSQQSQNTASGDSETESEDSQPDSEFTDSESEGGSSYSETDSSDESVSGEKGVLLKGTRNV